MRVKLQPSFVLHSRPYRDSSALLEIFTAEYGRLSLVARGARRQSRRKGSGGALLQPFTPLLLSFSGRSELKTLVATETAGTAIALRSRRLFSGMYVNELLVRLLHRHDAHPRLFAAYGETLQLLKDSAVVDTVLRRFELTLLDELGYSFDFARDGASGERVQSTMWYRYMPELGLVSSADGDGRSASLYAGSDLLAMAAGELGGDQRLVARRLLREVLAVHLGDAPLRSRELFRAGRPVSSSQSPPRGARSVPGGRS